ncbi:acylneuraminate cytidylyltransferase family protein [Pseudomonadales bacterium]|nr:acylneuraminate cytidylyltransferase family protein [Pseudomonadales bacterium]
MTKFLAVIPARGGSKGLPRKNLTLLAGKPLIEWTIDAALSSSYINSVVVSSDCNEILDFTSKFNVANVKRPDHLAADSISLMPAIQHLLDDDLVKKQGEFQYIVLLQPTSPLRTGLHIDEAIEKVLKSGCGGLISVNRVENKIMKYFYDCDGFLAGVRDNVAPFERRQDLPDVYSANGAIYITKTASFIKTGSLLTASTLPYVMNDSESIDIDSLKDLQIAEGLITQRLKT